MSPEGWAALRAMFHAAHLLATIVAAYWFFRHLWPEITFEPSTSFHTCTICGWETKHRKIYFKTGRSYHVESLHKEDMDRHYRTHTYEEMRNAQARRTW